MKIGILGTGFGAYHAKIYKNIEGVDAITVFGRDKDKLCKLKEELGVEITTSAEDIICNNSIDLVDICLPSALHKAYSIEALKNGKDVFCETPVCLSLDDLSAMQQAETQYHKRIFVDMFIRHEYPYEYLQQLVKSKELGRLRALHIRRKTPPLWGDLSLSRITTSLMIHELDLVTWLLGSPDSVHAAGINGRQDESHIAAQLTYADALVEVHASSMMPEYHPFTVGFEAVFDKGALEFREDGYVNRCEKSLMLFTNDISQRLEIPEKDCYEETIRHVLKCCQTGVSTRLSLTDAARSLELALIIKSMVGAIG